MKRVVSLICVVCISFVAMAQQQVVSLLPITTEKTTSLLFPSPIRHVDRGTPDVLAEQVKEADNLLLVKAAQSSFKQTNLTVVTADGQIYSFEVTYEESPKQTVYHLVAPQLSRMEKITFTGEFMNQADLEDYCKGILDIKKSMRGIRDTKWDIMGSVSGIYIKDRVIFYQLSLENISSINYDIDFIRFYIRDRKKGKRTANQEVEVHPLYMAGNRVMVPAMGKDVISVALEKFTLPDAKYLAVEIMEKNGGRHLTLRVRNNKIVKAISLPDLN